MKHFLRFTLPLCVLIAISVGNIFAVTVTTAGSGNWSSPTPNLPWPGGTPPGPSDDVVIADTCVITLDQDATVASLTVGQGISGTFQISKTIVTNLTINGNLAVNTGASFKVQTATTSFSGPHTLTISGNITHNGTVFDLRAGTSGTTLGVINVTFAGSTNSAVAINTAYSSTNGDFNAVTFNKTGGARVILGSNMYISGGSSTGPATMNSTLTFINGIVETGNFALVAQTSTAAQVAGYSSNSYVLGAMGRGMSNSGGSTKDFPVGDANGYRPLNLRSTTVGSATGHHAVVRVISGNANTGGSVLNGGIDLVSAVRYYQITYNQLLGGGAASMSFDRFYPTYGADDGVIAGNTNLRVAYSTDARATWNKLGQITSPHTTDLTLPPTQIKPDSVNPAISLAAATGTMYIALADSAASNPLPIQLASFTGQIVNGNIKLDWATLSELNNYGFYVQKRRTGETNWGEVSQSFVGGHGTTSTPQHYTFTDRSSIQGSWQYRLRQVDLSGAVHYTEPIQVDGPTSAAGVAPREFALKQNYPNPFNPSTAISFSVERTGMTTLEVFNVLGEKVVTLFGDVAEAGKNYDVKFDGMYIASGVYLYRLQQGEKIQIKQMVLLK